MPKFIQCPKCAALGKDSRKNNLAVYEDGHSFCYSCRHFVPAPTTVTSLLHKLSKPNNKPQQPIVLGDVSYVIPPIPKAWLSQYGITQDEIHLHNICWNQTKGLLYFPIYDGEALMGFSARYFRDNHDHPRYITKLFRRELYKFFPKRDTNIFVLVEDYISAIKVGRQFNCIPLLGSFVPLDLILKLVYQKPILRLWLDRDKTEESIKYTARARQFIPDCGTIITDKDPKEYTDDKIRGIVQGSLRPQGHLA